MAPVELLEKDAKLRAKAVVEEVLIDDEDELLIEEISIDGMCGVY